ncbi:single-stranded DNA-binding protein, partial [Paenibacillus sp. A51L]
MNRSILIGRLTKDPEMRYTPAGVAVTQFTLAVDRPFISSGEGREREADFIPIVTWRQLAETCANYLKKGRLTAVEGRIQVRHYENNEGKRVYVTEVIADNVRFLDNDGTSGNGGGGNRGGSNGGNGGARGAGRSGSGGNNRGGGQGGEQGTRVPARQ